MNESDRAYARAQLIAGVSLPALIDDLDRGLFSALVERQVDAMADRLPALVTLHRDLVVEGEQQAVEEVLASLLDQASRPEFWAATAGAVLNSISCDMNDALLSEDVDDAGVFNLFQLVTVILADRVRTEPAFAEMVRGAHAEPRWTGGASGSVTRMLSIAVNDFGAGRLSRKALLAVFQDAIDNGDVLLPANETVVVAHVVPLIDAGELRPSESSREFYARMDRVTRAYLDRREPGSPQEAEQRPWWRRWN